MNDKKVLITGIEYKVRKLVDQCNELKKTNALLLDENKKLKEIIEEKNIFVENLKEEIPKIKLAKSLESKEGSNEAKMKINELVREIDKCIGLLNQ